MKTLLAGMLCCAIGAAQGAPSLCTPTETVYFSCPATNGNIIALCGDGLSKDASGNIVEGEDPWLQYRYGRPGAVQLTYPSSKRGSLSGFKAEHMRAMGGAVGLDAMAFVNGGIGYEVKAVWPDDGKPWAGVDVGDPRQFDLDRGPRPRAHYPSAQVRCAGVPDTAQFLELVLYLRQQ